MQDAPSIEWVGPRRAARFWIPNYFVVRGIAVTEIALFAATCVAAQALYSGAPSVLPTDIAIGVAAGMVYALIGRHWGVFRFDSIIMLGRLQQLLFAASFSFVAVLVMYFFLKTGGDHSRFAAALFYVLTVAALFVERLIAARLVKLGIDAHFVTGRPVVLIGENGECMDVGQADLLQYGIDELARVEVSGEGDSLNAEDQRLVSKAIDFARLSGATEFALLMSWRRQGALEEIVALLRESPLSVRLYPDRKTRDILQKHRGSHFNPYLSIQVQRAPLSWSERSIKRALDFSVAATVLLLLSPLLAITAVLIKLESSGPVIFRQRRMGFDRGLFIILKFRTMTVLEDGETIEQAKRGDRRVTRVGRFLRQTSIDELPQLWNVMRGDMSLVGPRPHAIAHDIEYSRKIAAYARRHHVKPGLTGAAQVRGYRGETRTLKQMEDRVKWDLWYINNWSLLLDIQTASQTFVALLKNQSF